jgi:NodT family efflux transporter outer membrane factor (OMF) lipoprotein
MATKHLCYLTVAALAALGGCTSPAEFIKNGFKVGPQYAVPPAAVAADWIDASDKRVRHESDDLSKWWTVFNDPVLDDLICYAYKQNLTLRQAGFRVLAARAQLGISASTLFPQSQSVTGDFNRIIKSIANANSQFIPLRYYPQWDQAFNLAWEIDFWGKFRRTVESSRASLEASVADFDDVLVTLLGDVATNYVQLRVAEARIRYARENARLQRLTVKVVENRQKVNVARELDVNQAKSLLFQTEATIPELEIGLRLNANAICILLGIPPEDLQARLKEAPIPVAPTEVAVGIPADLLRRRPDIRRAERQAAAQCAQIGVAEADFYPHISLIGSIGYSAREFINMYTPKSLVGSFGPAFQWNILAYGRILNNMRVQEAVFQQLVTAYQTAVLNAQQEAENGLITFLKAQKRTQLQAQSVKAAEDAVKTVLNQYEVGTVTIAQLILLEQTLVGLQDTLAQAQGEIPTGLIQVYKAMGGGWEIRLNGCTPAGALQLEAQPAPELGPPPRHLPDSEPPPSRLLPPMEYDTTRRNS